LESLLQYLVVSIALFAIGVYGIVSKRNALRILFSIEIIANSAVLNLVVFSKFLPMVNITGQTFALITIAVLAAEAAAGLALILVAYRIHKDIDVFEMKELQG